jgi:hypothetical protein
MLLDLIHKIAAFYKRIGKYKVIMGRENPDKLYLERHYLLFPMSWEKFMPFNVYLHRFHESDDEAWNVLHDHPWNWISIILTGKYMETKKTENGFSFHERKAGSIRFGKADDAHRVDLITDPEVEEIWTIFITGRRFRDWGFVKDGQWTFWKDYLGLNRQHKEI